MNVAISLSKDNRFILRAAARCFMHVKEPDKALFYLHKTSLSQHDPWLLATEISVGEALQKRSRNIKRGVQLLSGQYFSPRALSELAGAIGTIEFKSGALKASRKLFKQSLVDPTENTAAQAEWISGRIGTEFVIERDKIPALYEANSRHYMKLGDHKKSYEQAVIWFEFQPFSSRPACFGSYVASMCLHDHQKALDIIEMAPPSSFGSITLQNNHAFALASLDRTTEALHVLQQIDLENLPEEDKYTLLATYGTICFRSEKLADGRESYEKAVKEFKKLGLRNKAAAALLYWGREEQRVLNIARSTLLLKEALDISKVVGPSEIKSYAETLLIRVDPVGPSPLNN
jgi:tetratricopeptide (TPR) repeat protein